MEDDAPKTRSRTISWVDPAQMADASKLSGMDFFKAVRKGEFPTPPFMSLVGYQLKEFEPGRVLFELIPAEHLYNMYRTLHGGAIASLLDSAMGAAIHTLLPAGSGYSTLEIKVNYVRAVTEASGVVQAEAKVMHIGGRVATAEGRVHDDQGRLCAHATATCLIVSRKK